MPWPELWARWQWLQDAAEGRKGDGTGGQSVDQGFEAAKQRSKERRLAMQGKAQQPPRPPRGPH